MAPERWYSRAGIDRFVQSTRVQTAVIVVILVNAAVLGLETVPAIMASPSGAGILHLVDKICLAVFILEILLKLYAQRLRFFTNAWNVFDFVVVGVALVPGADGFAVLRALRVLRVLRLISVIPALRRVVDALVKAIPGIASIAALLAIVFYVGAVMATMLFGTRFPTEFGDMGRSLFSLFQIMTLDNWSSLARLVTAEIPWAPGFFVPFVLISSLTVLNLFIAVIVDAMQGLDRGEGKGGTRQGEDPDAQREDPDAQHGPLAEPALEPVLTEIAALREQVAALTAALSRRD